MAIRLKEINRSSCGSPEMANKETWGAIERISKDLQELIQKDVDTDGEDEDRSWHQ